MRQVTNRDPAWRFWSAVAAAVFGTLAILLWVSSAVAAGDGTYTPVTLCHAHPTGAGGSGPANGYVLITVDQSGAFDGHLGHPNDIIPAGSFTDKQGHLHEWAAQGDQSILANGCVIPVTCEDEGNCPPPPPTDCNGDTNPDNNGPFGNCDEGVMVCQNGEVQLEPTGTVDDGTCVNIPPPCKPCNPPPPGGPSNPPVPPSPTVKQYQQDVQNGAEPGGG